VGQARAKSNAFAAGAAAGPAKPGPRPVDRRRPDLFLRNTRIFIVMSSSTLLVVLFAVDVDDRPLYLHC
jgi:hypothetical protein